MEDDLQLEKVYVLGTNCADNSPTPEAAENFLRNGVAIGETKDIQGYEFMQDFKVHVKGKDTYTTKPYFTLPGTIAEASISPSCLACFDYTNSLADVVIGYMGAPLDSSGRMDQSYQTLTVRNENGERLTQTALDRSSITLEARASGSGSHESLASATVGSDSIILKMVDKPVPETGMPKWIGEIMAFVISSVGPKGINFARYSIDYHILRNYLHVLNEWGVERSETCLPQSAQRIVAHYHETNKSFSKLEEEVLRRRKR